jgi:uncharacterized membrane protein YbhN (UPF0104 family)
MRDASAAPTKRRSPQWLLVGSLAVITIGATFLAIPALAGIPARLIEGCARWIVAAGALELLSALGFVVLFKLVFTASVGWRRSAPAGLRALAASTILPAGGLIGPAVGVCSTKPAKPSVAALTRSTITFVLLTNAPGAIVLVVVGTLLWLGVPGGPHQAALTIVPALLASAVLVATWSARHAGQSRPRALRRGVLRLLARPAVALGDGVGDAHTLVAAGDWKLAGALAYYAFDNAVLWAAFHAYGHTPAIGVIVMGYLVGSLAGALPLPAGLGAVDGGMIGALVLYGAPAAPAAAAVLLYRGISLLLPVLLGAVASGRLPAALRLRVEPRGTQQPTAPEPVTAALVGS